MKIGVVSLQVFFYVLIASGQLLFKKVAETSDILSSFSGILGLLTNFWFWVALVIYGIATLLWIYILQKIALSQAYPFVALGFIFVPLGARFLFQGSCFG